MQGKSSSQFQIYAENIQITDTLQMLKNKYFIENQTLEHEPN